MNWSNLHFLVFDTCTKCHFDCGIPKMVGQKSTYSKETIVFCEYNERQLVKNWAWVWKIKTLGLWKSDFGTFGSKQKKIFWICWFSVKHLGNYDPPSKKSITELTLMHSSSPMDPTTSQNVVIVAKSTIMPRFTMLWLRENLSIT